MSLEDNFHEAMLAVYTQAGKEVGYWASYFLRAVRRHGGLETAHRMLLPLKNESIQSGLQALIDAGRADISVESLVLRPQFQPLFSELELNEARRRLSTFPDYTIRKRVQSDSVFPETLPPDLPYFEGAVRKVTINSYERDPKARAVCLARHGYNCSVCNINFKEKYGAIGEQFIHVHHKKPLATIRKNYELKPTKDLVPVCPNCHAMLHTSEPPLSVSELKSIIEKHRINVG